MSIRLAFTMFALGASTALGALSLLSHNSAARADPLRAQQPSPDDMAKGMKAWMEAMKPGIHHKTFDDVLGQWDTVTKVWWGGPGTTPSETKGTTERRWVLGNRFVLEEAHGQMPMPDATGAMKMMPLEGMGMFGYDNFRNMYVGCWADTAGTQLLTMKGMADPSGKVITYFGEMDEPMMNVVGRTVKYVTRIVDKDTNVFEIYDLHAGDAYKVVEVTYKRKK
jgi:hypothetical protein